MYTDSKKKLYILLVTFLLSKAAVKRQPVHLYSVVIFTLFGPLGLLGSEI